MSKSKQRNRSSESQKKTNESSSQNADVSLENAGENVEEAEEALEQLITHYEEIVDKLTEIDRNRFLSIIKRFTGREEAIKIEKEIDETREKFEEVMKQETVQAEKRLRKAKKSVIKADPNLRHYIIQMQGSSLEQAVELNGTELMGKYVHDRASILNVRNRTMNPRTMMYCRILSRSDTILSKFENLESNVDQKLVEAESKIEAGEDPEEVAKSIFSLLGSDLGLQKVKDEIRKMKNIELEEPSKSTLETGF